MNLATGVKEARLNVPEPGTAHSDLVIIDEPEIHRQPEPHDQAVLKEPPRVRPPRFDPDEAILFHSSMSTLKSASANDEALAPALSDLQELCHSQDWGLALTKDGAVIQFLVQTLQDIYAKLAIRSLSALLIATAIQNNPEALSAALSHFYNDELPNGPLDAVMVAILQDQCPQLLTRAVFLLSALCQDPKQLSGFAQSDGLHILLRVFDVEHAGQDERDKLRGKIANFVLDYLDQLDDVAAKVEERKAAEALAEKEENNRFQQDDGEWVVVHNRRGMSGPKDDDFNKGFLENLLKDWKDVFGKSIEKMSSSHEKSGSAALESLVEAHAAVSKRLGRP